MLNRSNISLLLCLLESFFVHLFCLQKVLYIKRKKRHFQSPKGQAKTTGTHQELGRFRKHPALGANYESKTTAMMMEQSAASALRFHRNKSPTCLLFFLNELLHIQDKGNKIPWQPFESDAPVLHLSWTGSFSSWIPFEHHTGYYTKSADLLLKLQIATQK